MVCWIGLLAGAYIGSRLGLGPVGTLAGSLLGSYVEFRIRMERRRAGHGSRGPSRRRDAVAEAYRTLGVPFGATKAEVKRAYRELAKECHPDMLRSRGATDGEIAAATERMSRINAAWRLLR